MNMFVNKKNIAPNKKKKKASVGETLYLLVHSRPLLDCILLLLIVSAQTVGLVYWIGLITGHCGEKSNKCRFEKTQSRKIHI